MDGEPVDQQPEGRSGYLLKPASGSYKDTFGENSFIKPDPHPPVTLNVTTRILEQQD
ncbi:rCG63636 [Rattus norvegicus]|uniref:RCG63636 n=1 Tax=Rattus norvegicus TaxID=10116 RepID=A6I0P8_RAT|nr:rCG63636 [Rattus norvegicus]